MADDIIKKRITDSTYTEVTSFATDDVLFIDSPTQGTRKINAKTLYDAISTEIGKALKCSNVYVDANNYSSIITDVNNQPMNTIYAYGNGLSSLVANLPSDISCVIVHFSASISSSRTDKVMIAIDRNRNNSSLYFRTTYGQNNVLEWSSWQKVADNRDVEAIEEELNHLVYYFVPEDIAFDGYDASNDAISGLNNAPYVIEGNFKNSNWKVDRIRLNVVATGSLTVGVIKKSDVVVGETIDRTKTIAKEVLNIATTGPQEVTIQNKFSVNDDEYLYIGATTDGCTFKYGSYGNQKGFFATSNNVWIRGTRSIGINVYIKNQSEYVTKPLEGKKLSILGDSISTYQGYIPSGYSPYYPNSDVNDVTKTWWSKLISLSDMTLLKNASWSGSGVTGDISTTNGRVGCSDARINELKDGTTTPDIIICYITTNDWANDNAIGTFDSKDEIDLTPRTISNISEAYALMLYKLRTTYPNAFVYCVTSLEGRTTSNDTVYPILNGNSETIHEVNHAITEIAHIFGARVIDLQTCGIHYWNIGNYSVDGKLHPNNAGMTIIAETIYKQLLRDFKV